MCHGPEGSCSLLGACLESLLPPFAFNGTIDSVEIKLGANKLSAADKKISEEAEKD